MSVARVTRWSLLALLLVARPADAQERLSLDHAIHLALGNNPAVVAAREAEGEAAQQVVQARAGFLPRIDLLGAWQRSNNPVFAFSSLLSQRRFSEADFAVHRLNHPDAIDNVRSVLLVEQPLVDAETRALTHAATLRRDLAEAGTARTRTDLALAVTRTYGRVLTAEAGRRAAAAAVNAAGGDLTRAEHRRDAGTGTEADVLSMRVHLARMREQQIRADGEETVARAALNRLMNVPLDRAYALDEVLRPETRLLPLEELERQALRLRAEIGEATLQQRLTDANRARARAAFLPRISFEGAYELNGSSLDTGASAWSTSVQMRWNLFSGWRDAARLREAGHAAARARAERESLEDGIRLEVRTALSDLETARAREAVGRAALDEARESQRIIRDRFDVGLATMSDLLRVANAVLQAELEYSAARTDAVVGAAALDRAVGRIP